MRRSVIVALFILVAGAVPASGPRSAAAGFVTSCFGEPPTILAAGPGTVYGTGGRDVIVANDAVAQTIYALGGGDLICAANDDTVFAGSGDDSVQISFFGPGVLPGAVHGESGNDSLVTALVEFVSGGSGNDFVTSQFGSELRGGAGNDVLDAIGVGTCDGGSGQDQFDTNDDCTTVLGIP